MPVSARKKISRLARLIEEPELKSSRAKRSGRWCKRRNCLENSQRQDAKRLTDLQGSGCTAGNVRKNSVGKVDINTDSIRKLETRLGEIQTNETGAANPRLAFLKNKPWSNVERDRIWKDWQTRFDEIAEFRQISIHSSGVGQSSKNSKRAGGF